MSDHGTISRYSNNGCRCDACRQANARYNLARKRERTALGKKDPRLLAHGYASTYSNWGCRCDECRQAWNADAKARRLRAHARRDLAKFVNNEPLLPRKPMSPTVEHGYGPYTRGCRCDICRDAKRAYVRERRALGPLASQSHGTSAKYDAGCICPECIAAKAREGKTEYRRNRETYLARMRARRAS